MTTDTTAPAPKKFGRHIGMRWKLLIAFGLGFTAVFVALAAWILSFSTGAATDRLTETLRQLSEGGARTIDADAFVSLAEADLTPEVGATYPDNAGILAGTVATEESVYPTDPAFWNHVDELAFIRRTNPEASPYTFWRDADGTVRWIGSWGALGYPEMGVDPPAGGVYGDDVLGLIDEATLGYFEKGFDGTTEQPAYSDAVSDWISVYSPISNADGDVVGAIGVDYDLRYVDEVRSKVVRVLYPVFGVGYVILLILVGVLSGRLTRRLGRLSSATKRIAEGDYALDLTSVTDATFSDEMSELATSFQLMADKVGARERTLTQAVQVLKVEIDEQKRRESVAEITDTDFFSDLTSKAGAMRAKVKAFELMDGPAGAGE